MVNYRRNYIPGGTYFFTMTLRNRQSSILVDYIDELQQSFRFMRATRPVTINAMVILPEHLHTVMTLPEKESDYPGLWKSVKSKFTHLLKKKGVPISKDKRGEHHLWQRRYWEHTIKNDVDYRRHVDYVHYNPVKHGLVKSVKDWPYSSFHRYVKEGVVDECWGKDVAEDGGEFGE